MNIYRVEATISGMNDKPAIVRERLVCSGWVEVHEMMARICTSTGCVIQAITITKTTESPFDYEHIKVGTAHES